MALADFMQLGGTHLHTHYSNQGELSLYHRLLEVSPVFTPLAWSWKKLPFYILESECISLKLSQKNCSLRERREQDYLWKYKAIEGEIEDAYDALLRSRYRQYYTLAETQFMIES